MLYLFDIFTLTTHGLHSWFCRNPEEPVAACRRGRGEALSVRKHSGSDGTVFSDGGLKAHNLSF